MRKTTMLTAVSVLAILAGCAGRAPQPVAVVQPEDRYLDCTAIQAEVSANDKTIRELGSEEGEKTAQNVAAGVAGLFLWPLWFGMDFQGAAGKEETALQSRQEYLAALSLQKGCASRGARPTLAAAANPPTDRASPAIPAPLAPCGTDRPCAQFDPLR